MGRDISGMSGVDCDRLSFGSKEGSKEGKKEGKKERRKDGRKKRSEERRVGKGGRGGGKFATAVGYIGNTGSVLSYSGCVTNQFGF